MSIYHLSVKPISRSAARSATAAAAYRCAALVIDERTGRRFDFTKKKGVMATQIILPAGAPGWAQDRSKLWNAAEAAERRKDACVAREYEVALPCELSDEQRFALVQRYTRELVELDGCAIEFAIHAPAKNRDGECKNWHVHILRTTRHMTFDGLGEKLESEKAGRNRKVDLEAVRAHWTEVCNAALKEAGIDQQIDHRSNADRGLADLPTIKVGHKPGTALRRIKNSQIRLVNQRLADAHRERTTLIFEQERKNRMRAEIATRIRVRIDDTIKPNTSLETLRTALESGGVELIEIDGDKLMFTASGERIDGGHLGCGYDLAAMVERGLVVPPKTTGSLDFLVVTNDEPVRSQQPQQQLVASLEDLISVIASLAWRLQEVVAKLLNSILERCGVQYRVFVFPYVVPSLREVKLENKRPVQMEVATEHIRRITAIAIANDGVGFARYVAQVPEAVLTQADRKDGSTWFAHRRLCASEDTKAMQIQITVLSAQRSYGPKDAHWDAMAMQEGQLRDRVAQIDEQRRMEAKRRDFQALLDRSANTINVEDHHRPA